MRKIILSGISLLIFTVSAAAEKRSYECAAGEGGKIKINFSVKDSDPLDKISGKAVFQNSGYESDFKGTYNLVLDVLVGYVQSSATAKKKLVSGNLDSDTDTFYLSAKVSKTLSVEFVCPRKKKKSDLLTGPWVVNGVSFFAIQLNEGFDGAIKGKGLTPSFTDYTISGLRTNDGNVSLSINSPNGDDDSTYTMTLCSSGSTMVGKSDSTVFPDTVMCRKNRAINQECQPDATC